jgi:hypothetical protein
MASTVPEMLASSLAVAVSPLLVQLAMSPAPTTTALVVWAWAERLW